MTHATSCGKLARMRYRAFISYSHTDAAAAQWLHRALEAYSVPRRLRGQPGPHGPRPSRIYPVFRDREELPTASDLSLTIQAALTESEGLIVVCSPRAAASRWLAEEIRFFQKLGRGDRVFCLIADGDPADSFPPALGNGAEPLAADIRRGRDGRGAALLKLAAGLLGVSFADLRQRERRRAAQRRAVLAAGVALAAGVVAIAYVAASDAGLRLPASVAIRRALDSRDASLFRPAHPIAQDVAARDAAEQALLARLDREERAGLWVEASPTRPFGPKLSINVWIAAQAACAAFHTLPPHDRRVADFTAALDAVFAPGLAVERDGRRYGWLDSAADFPQAEPTLWTVAALAAAAARPDTAPARPSLLARLDYAQAAADTYRPTDDGGWNMFARQDEPEEHSAYTTTLALLALLELRRAGLGWRGDPAARDAMIAAAAGWLAARFEPDTDPPGWHGGPADAGPVADGLTLQAMDELLQAEAEAGIPLSPAIAAAIPPQIADLGERTMSYGYTATRFIRSFTNVDDAHVTRFQDVRYLWHPWAVALTWRWLERLQRTGAPAADRVAVRRTLGHLVVDAGAPAFAEQARSKRDVFVTSESLLGLAVLQ